MVNGKERRLRRLLDEDGRTLLVAVDHSLTTGKAGGLANMPLVLEQIVRGGADAIVAHRGSASAAMPVQRGTALVIQLSGSMALSHDGPRQQTRVCDPATAMALGADAVSAQLTLGMGRAEDREGLRHVGQVAGECDRLGLPLLVMAYAAAAPAQQAEATIHAARAAAELGADIVKAAHPGAGHLDEIVETVMVPVVLAGGEATGSWPEFLQAAGRAIDAGVAGLCVGRRIFGHADPTRATSELHARVHRTSVSQLVGEHRWSA